MTVKRLRLTRRQALGLAAGGAAGAVGLRYALHLGGSSSIASAGGPAGAWASPLADSRAKIAHLLRRGGFGYNDADLDTWAKLSYADAVEQLLHQSPEALTPPSDLTNHTALSQSWYEHMATTRAPFPERMLLFWHGLLTSDYRKAAQLPFVYEQNLLYRQLGRSDLRTLLVRTTSDPLMMRYLDLDKSSSAAPNENYSRELMELYTLGVGNFTEDDVREGARALSGLRILLFDKSGAVVQPPQRMAGAQQQFAAAISQLVLDGAQYKGVLVPSQHDSGVKHYLGRVGNLGPEDVIDTILSKDACATFIATKALVYFCNPSPSDDLVGRIAKQFRDSRYDITTLMRAIFMSDDFTQAANYRSLVRSPVDFIVAIMRTLSRSDLARTAVPAGTSMDQTLYDPPTVAGWPTNQGWISSSSWLARVNYASAVVASTKTFPDPLAAVRNQLDNVVGSDTAQVFNASSSTADRWYALLASPEFNLK